VNSIQESHSAIYKVSPLLLGHKLMILDRDMTIVWSVTSDIVTRP